MWVGQGQEYGLVPVLKCFLSECCYTPGGVTSGVDFLYEVISAGDISRLSYIMARGHGARFAVLYFVVIFVAV